MLPCNNAERDASLDDLERRRCRDDVGVELVRVDADLLLVAVVLALLVDVEERHVELVEHRGRTVGGVDEREAQERRAVVAHVDLAEELPLA